MRCQQFGHTKTYCNKPYLCVKCGGPHNTKDCKKPKDAPAKCALCGGSHTANYRGCEHYHRTLKNKNPTFQTPLPPITSEPAYVNNVEPATNRQYSRTYADAVANNTENSSGTKVVPLDWWPLTRDCLAYGITVSILICIIHDERVEWYEALCLVLLYIVYILIMYFDKPIQKCVRGSFDCTSENEKAKVDVADVHVQVKIISDEDQNKNQEGKMATPLPMEPAQVLKEKCEPISIVNASAHLNGSLKHVGAGDRCLEDDMKGNNEEAKDEPHSLCRFPKKKSTFTKITWIVTWPIHVVFLLTIPDCEKARFKKWFPLTFIMCIVWIGSLSYAVAWMITIIGDTLKIPDSVMGITFLAAGTSVPEAVSSVIVAKQGHGSMGISNSIGSNTFDILLCLGLPWFIKATFMPTITGKYWVGINSAGIEYSAISLLSTLLLLYATFALNNFKLDKRVGRICLLMYACFLVLASLIELNAFFRVNLPTCGRS
ncbi:unnamed protein product [Acanthoscelides obtectus]|uniref:Sodium/calcium exchanger membrane region domain-containing protein n=1 Tax=Acanthoscelides obtectus TaxID=200917 RepID=A0A9P0JWT6_ACAOB|nr:unnamed protein product [Acanthoscelides obtectus]CAK1668153.1 Probable sodium/potassium/calcium exchanger CG1090 [Acanthoscelides obtectus]